MDSRNRTGEATEGGAPAERAERAPDSDGVDRTLIRWMLSLTPAERLEVLQRHVEAVVALRGGA